VERSCDVLTKLQFYKLVGNCRVAAQLVFIVVLSYIELVNEIISA
jgi:hypothetical protein